MTERVVNEDKRELVEQVSKKLNIDKSLVKKVVDSQFHFLRLLFDDYKEELKAPDKPIRNIEITFKHFGRFVMREKAVAVVAKQLKKTVGLPEEEKSVYRRKKKSKVVETEDLFIRPMRRQALMLLL